VCAVLCCAVRICTNSKAQCISLNLSAIFVVALVLVYIEVLIRFAYQINMGANE